MGKTAKIIVIVIASLVIVACIALIVLDQVLAPTIQEQAALPANAELVDAKYAAHRGFSAKEPENSLPAIESAGDEKYWGAEFDIRATKDGVWIIMHDDNIYRTTNGFSKISNLTFEKLQSYKLNNGANIDKYDDLKVPTLADVLKACKEKGMVPCIEIKEPGTEKTESFLAEIGKNGFELDEVIVLAFDAEQLRYIRERNKDIVLWYLSALITEESMKIVEELGNSALSFNGNKQENTDEIVKGAVGRGIVLSAWTIDDVAVTTRYYNLGVRLFTTNRIVPSEKSNAPIAKAGN